MTYHHLSVEEREAVQRGLWEKKSYRTIAHELGRSPASISREVRRNLPPLRFQYTPRLAHARALTKRTSRGRIERLKNPFIRTYVVHHLTERRWSPEQIAGRLSADHPEEGISHEAIYQFIYAHVSPANALPYPGHVDLRPYLKHRHRLRVSKAGRRAWRLAKPCGPSIDVRPPIVARRDRVGDWEGDTVVSKDRKPGINTLVERATGYVFMTKLHDKTSMTTVAAVSDRMRVLPKSVKHTLTLDNGPENTDWQGMQATTSLAVFFAHPYHSWERGTNENTNGLIRYYFPKKTDFTKISARDLSRVEWELNNRPRKRLAWRTPQEVLSVALQS